MSDKNDCNDSCLFKRRWVFSDLCLEYLLRFFKLIIQPIKSNYLIESIQELFEIYPSSIYMARQRIYLERFIYKFIYNEVL